MSDPEERDTDLKAALSAALAENARLADENAHVRRLLDATQQQLESLRGDVERLRESGGGHAADALQESENRFRTLADNIAQLAWMADGDGWIFWYNKRWFDFTGTSLDEMVGWGWRDVHHPDHIDRVLALYQSRLRDGEAWEDLFPLRGADGEYRWFLSRALPIRDQSGNIVRWFGTNTDVTEQRAVAEQLRDAHKRKDEYIAMLGHELRNPLAAIRNAADVIGSFKLDEPQLVRALGALNRQTNHMGKLLDGLLEVTRIARGKIELDWSAVDVRALTLAVMEDMDSVARERAVELQAEVGDQSVWVWGDPVRLVQVLENLLGNAIKFSSRGGCVRVRLRREGEQVAVQVKDWGAGIGGEMLDQVFQPFVQGAQNVARESGGLGLGLAVAKGLMDLHGGSIEVDSPGLGEGAEFTLRMKVTTAPVEEAATEARPHAVRRVMIVEDNEDAAAMLAMLLKRRGHEVQTVARAEAGLVSLREGPVDVVVCDLGLPDMSGHDFAAAVRSDAQIGGVRLIALSGYGQAADRERSLAAGFDAHLTKPANVDALEAAMLD